MNDELFSKNTNLVYAIAHKMKNSYVEVDDLIQVGLMALFAATKKYDINKNTKFSSYASIYIVNAMRQEMKNNQRIKLSREMYKILKKISTYNNTFNIDEIALEMNINKEEIILAMNYQNIDSTETDQFISEPIITDSNELLCGLDGILKKIIDLRYYYGWTQSRVANNLKISQAKVSRLEKKALNIIKKSQ